MLKIFTTGGTIDKIYFDAKSQYEVGESIVADCLGEANVTLDYDVESILSKDSLDITDDDRKLIHDKVLAESNNKILITHGTDTMTKTAACLGDIKDKTIVFTGSMQPARLRYSDAVFNIGYAIAAVQQLSPGIYIAMNGQVFDSKKTRKNPEKHCFEDI